MRKNLCIFIIIFFVFSIKTKAQLDLEHWFAPVYKAFKPSATDKNDVYLYLSTPHAQPFRVDIYTGNIFRQSIMLSKSTPYKYKVDGRDYVIELPIRAFKAAPYGVHVAGENSFYASLRMDLSGNQKEVITSKGKTALGKTFYSINTDNNVQEKNFVNNLTMFTSIIATVDNTKVKISGYNKSENPLKFGGYSNPNFFFDFLTNSEFNVTLNKGESYTVFLWKKYNRNDYFDSRYNNFIGSKIEADKPITVTSGNFNGNFNNQYFEAERGGMLVDQSLPVDQLGTEYYFKKGFTSISGDNDKVSEKCLIVATEDGTEVTFNGNNSSTFILNSGEYYCSNHDFNSTEWFVNDGMYIKTSKPAYVYQLTSGTEKLGYRDEPLAWQHIAMALVPPLDDELPNKIDYIPNITEVANNTQDVILHITTKHGAQLSVNGTLLTNAQSIEGNSQWQSYTLNNPGTNVEIASSESVVAGFLGGRFNNSGIASAGYYTGFSNDPYILVNGNCVQEEMQLYLNNIDFEGFQWQLNGIDIPGANSSNFTPQVAGNYTCVLFYSGLSYTTQSVVVSDCPYTVSTRNVGTNCTGFSVVPSFGAPNENLSIATVEILSQPFHGNVIYENGLFTVDSSGFVGNDRFVYKITAANGFYEIVKIEYSILPQPIADIKSEIQPTASIDATYYYIFDDAVNTSNSEIFAYYESLADAENLTNEISNTQNYPTDIQKYIYVRITNSYGCFRIKRFLLVIPEKPLERISLPNVITPNGDGYNDIWNYDVLKRVELLKLQIFNRFGMLVFQHQFDSENYFWNGKDQSNSLMPTGSYWVVYQYYNSEGTLKTDSMWVYLKSSAP